MITLEQQIKCVGREIGMRRNVYPKFVGSGKMSQEKADYEIAAMTAVYETLKNLRTASAPPEGS
jgi:hypothetical protein